MLPAWVSYLEAFLTPTIAIVGLMLGVFNYRLARRRRRDDLFGHRYEFYQRVRSLWLSTGNGAANGQRPWLEQDELYDLAEEAGFLFGEDITQHILSLADKQHTGHGVYPEQYFIAPFAKYLSLGRSSLY